MVEDLIVAGYGVGLLPVGRPTGGGVKVIPLANPTVVLTAYAVTRTGRVMWPPLRAVLDRLRPPPGTLPRPSGRVPLRAGGGDRGSGDLCTPFPSPAGLGRPEVSAVRALKVYDGAMIAQQVLPVRIAIAWARTILALPAVTAAWGTASRPAARGLRSGQSATWRTVDRAHAGGANSPKMRCCRRRGLRTACRTRDPPPPARRGTQSSPIAFSIAVRRRASSSVRSYAMSRSAIQTPSPSSSNWSSKDYLTNR